MTEIYNDGVVAIRTATMADAAFIGPRLREADRTEIELAYGIDPKQAVIDSLKGAHLAFCWTRHGNPVGIVGVNEESWLSDRGCLWCVATNDLDQMVKTFQKCSKPIRNIMLDQFPVLYNWIHVENTVFLKWSRWLGARVEDPKPYGVQQKPFCYFEYRRDDHVR